MIGIILSGAMGLYLALIGFPFTTWQFWGALVLWAAYGMSSKYEKD